MEKPGADKRGVLVCLSGERSNELVKLRRDATIFGREKADVVINDPEVSSTHCQIQNINEVYHIFDMNSSNGTFVNKEKIVKARLREGDIITIGGTSFRFGMEDEKKVRHIPTLFKSNPKHSSKTNSLVDTLIERELRGGSDAVMTINVVYHNGKSETLHLSQRVVFIGRASSFGAFDQDPEISRKHLMIKLNDANEVFVEDQGSTNGSYINGKRISGMHRVRPTDEVKVGLCRLSIAPKEN